MPAQSLPITPPIAVSGSDERVCPKCRTSNETAALERRQYRCIFCGLELVHLDMAANGAVRGVFGWLLNPGTVVRERYKVVAVLGKGGFGVTYLVDDIRLAGKRRALKEIPALLSDEYETRLLGRLNHPAIPDIIDRFEVDGMVYLVLQFGGSRTLRIEMDRQGGRIPVFLLLPWIEQVCAALLYLHSQDPPIIHRDLKPENILLDENDRVMLIDFGIAKESAGDNMTRTLGRAATHGFSPPEQVLGTGTDARSDVYALGAILYCAITGRVPPAAHERITGTVLEPPSRLLPEIPPLLDAAICQALELNLQMRQQSIAELAQCLELVRSGGASAHTVVAVDSTAVMAGSRVAEAVRLAGVEFPSLRQSQRTATEPSVREQPPVEPKPRPRPWAWVGMGLAGFVMAGASGWLYWRSIDQGPRLEPPKVVVSPVRATAPLVQAPDNGAPSLPAPPASAPPILPIKSDISSTSNPVNAGASVQPILPIKSDPVAQEMTNAGGQHAAPNDIAAPPQAQPPATVNPSISGPGTPGQAGPAVASPGVSLMDEYNKYHDKQGPTAPPVPQTTTVRTPNKVERPRNYSGGPKRHPPVSTSTRAQNNVPHKAPQASAPSPHSSKVGKAIDAFNRIGKSP